MKIKKNLLLPISLLIFTSGTALANGGSFMPQPAPQDHSIVAYVGANISADSSHYKTTITDIRIANGEVQRFSDGSMSDVAVDGGLFAGIGVKFMQHFYAGVEGFADLSDNKATQSVTDLNANNLDGLGSVDFSAKQVWDAGVSFLPGIYVNDKTLFYGRIGYVNGEFKISGHGLALLPNGAGDQVPFDFKNDESGIQFGLGIETALTKQIGLRAEWDLNRYESFTNPVIKQTGEREGDLTFTHPIINQFKLGLDYHFNLA